MKKKPDKVLTLCFVCDYVRSEIFLALKKSRFGEGKLNGYGGKVRPGRKIETEAIRELKAESMLVAKKIKEVGLVYFKFLDSGKEFECHIYLVDIADCKGQPKETKEMGPPECFGMNEKSMPFDRMWPGDRLFFPFIFEGQDFHGWILYDNPVDKNVLNYKLSPC